MGRWGLLLLVGLLWGCAGHSGGAASPQPPPMTTAPTTAPSGPAARGPEPGRLRLVLGEMAERTGGELGLAAPMLLVTVRNEGPAALDVPQLGVDMLLSLRLSLLPLAPSGAPAGKSQWRRATLLRPWTVSLAPLAGGGALLQGLSPLSVDRRDVPLPPGRYRAMVCVPPSGEAAYPSPFTDRYGGACSNELTITVKRRR